MWKLLFLFIVALQLPLPGQTLVRYRYVTTNPSGFAAVRDSATATARSVQFRDSRATSLLSVASHDSAGGVIWQLTVDSTVNDYVARDSVIAARIPAPSTTTAAPKAPSIYQIFVRGAKPVSASCCGTAAKLSPLDSLNPSASLLQRYPGPGMLIPNPGLPAKVGEVRVDTFAKHMVSTYRADTMRTNPATGQLTRMAGSPASDTYDTTIVHWKRTSADTIDASVSRVTMTIITRADDMVSPGGMTLPRSSTRGDGTGTYRIVYDAKQGIQSAKVSSTMVTKRLDSMGLPQSSITQEYMLVRIP